ncbi:uncharacterized protein CIMG_09755 [Coccidioides immitis RS]|uniref:Uncharacterized protein n=1 Tax=Coccidioides immitis (strain RS) TaxID=246410 RepID=J3K330_COCIM|nr:uncharacterized protein CIMG_09755 [Coccidioides immitis RS]EAS28551.3 hypothetical protein CIMG_09755 [Coccidioides immitis RS]
MFNLMDLSAVVNTSKPNKLAATFRQYGGTGWKLNLTQGKQKDKMLSFSKFFYDPSTSQLSGEDALILEVVLAGTYDHLVKSARLWLREDRMYKEYSLWNLQTGDEETLIQGSLIEHTPPPLALQLSDLLEVESHDDRDIVLDWETFHRKLKRDLLRMAVWRSEEMPNRPAVVNDEDAIFENSSNPHSNMDSSYYPAS